MTSVMIDGMRYVARPTLRQRLGRLGAAAASLGATVAATASKALPLVRAKGKPAARHVAEHAYSILGLGCIDSAAFYHSVFAGLLVTGASWFFFEWKVSE